MIYNEFVERVRAIEYTTEHARTLFNGRPQNNIKVITVSGDSMEGTINPGDGSSLMCLLTTLMLMEFMFSFTAKPSM